MGRGSSDTLEQHSLAQRARSLMPASDRHIRIPILLLLSIASLPAALLFRTSESPPKHPSPLVELVHCASHLHRPTEARLSGGFVWAPFSRAGLSADRDSAFAATAGEILAQESKRTCCAVQYAAATATLMTGGTSEAVLRFEQLTRYAPDNAALWNDLAAARYETARVSGEAALLPAALAAADHSLRLAPHYAEAEFNRALILSRLGFIPDAKRAWRAAATAERTPEWAHEVNLHLRELRDDDSTLFAGLLERAVDAA